MKIKIFLIFFLISFGSLAQYRPLINGSIVLDDSANDERFSLPEMQVASCSLRAGHDNTGKIYVGGSTVTNAGGLNPGIPLSPGDSISSIGSTKAQWIYVATDTEDDVVFWVCN
jgi:hypothetical protein